MSDRNKKTLDEMQDISLLDEPVEKVKNKKIKSVKTSPLGVKNDVYQYAVTIIYDDGSKVKREMDAVDIVATLWAYLNKRDRECFKKSDLRHNVYASVKRSSSQSSDSMFKSSEVKAIGEGDAAEETTKPGCCVIL